MQDTNSRATPCDPWTLMKNATSFTKKYVDKYFGFQGGWQFYVQLSKEVKLYALLIKFL